MIARYFDGNLMITAIFNGCRVSYVTPTGDGS